MSERKITSSERDDGRRHLAARLRDARNYLGFEQEEVANALGIPRTALSDIESGRRKVEDLELQRLAKLFRQPESQLLSDDADEVPLSADVARLVPHAARMSEQDREELGRFADYLRCCSKRRKAPGVSTNHTDAVCRGSTAASRLHQELKTSQQIEGHGGGVDVFGAINSLGIPLLLRPLSGLLGAYLNNPTPGILVTTERKMAVQRFTAGYELGHLRAGHDPSLDDEGILLRTMEQQSTSTPTTGQLQEVEANAFAMGFLIPRWLIKWHADQQRWRADDFEKPRVVYQLSLRLGASYEATCWTLSRYDWISDAEARRHVELRPRELKMALLGGHHPDDYRGDVWHLTERDMGLRIDGSGGDHFVLKLQEHSGSGYIWNIDQLKESGFAVVRDARDNPDADGIGGHALRSITAHPDEPTRGVVTIDEGRPWLPEPPLSTFVLDYDFSGPETRGLSRAERRTALEAA